MDLSDPSAMTVDRVPQLSINVSPCVFFKVPTDTGIIRYNPFSPCYFYDTLSLVCLLAIRFIDTHILSTDDRNNVRAYQRRLGFTTAATHVLETPFIPTYAERVWWLAKYNTHRHLRKRIAMNRSFLVELSALECIVINRLLAEKQKKVENAKRAKELEGAVISSKRRLPLDDESDDDAERNAKRQRRNNGGFSKLDPPLDPTQLKKCRFDVVDDAVKPCDCKRGCKRTKRSYYYNNALEKVPIVYPVIMPQPSKSQPKPAAVTLLMDGTTDDTVDGVVVAANDSSSTSEVNDGPSFAKVYMKRTAAMFTRKDSRKRTEWRTQGWRKKRMGSALKCELKLAPSNVHAEDTIIVDRTQAGRGLDYMQPTLENI